MKIVAISDIHGMILPKDHVPACDLLLIAGDVTWHKDVDTELEWLNGQFKSWLEAQKAQEIVAIAGNHDFSAVFFHDEWKALPWTYLRDETIDVLDETIHGCPWSNEFGQWAFMGDENLLTLKMMQVPDHTTILMTHGPPWSMGDKVIRGTHEGSMSFYNRANHLMHLKLHVWGHIHEARGVWYTKHIGVNASHVDHRYKPYREKPFTVEVINL